MISSKLELWGGAECTVNRVGDRYFDQLARTGHADRIDDVRLMAELGVKALRVPVLWERTMRDGDLATASWAWADERLGLMRELGIRPIVGLVHHGSGPRSTSLLDDGFADGLARFARAVAQRYPWVQDFTPVNEPMTTARFSCLYGHWYPHHRLDTSFVRALLVETRATVKSMRAIREVTPNARLVQTEDIGSTASTSKLSRQAAFENARRWSSLDLLYGWVNVAHPMHRYLRDAGATHDELSELRRNPCPPDLIGANYYVTSDRFLDHRIERYPAHTHGGNAWQRYADVEAVRVRAGIVGFGGVIRQCWRRYRTPIALTEVHIGCTPDEQVRWFAEAWTAANDALSSGIDVRAVTAWSMFGAFDWCSLVTRAEDRYEHGAFDVRNGTPTPTALAAFLSRLGRGVDVSRAGADRAPGWWRRQERELYGLASLIASSQAVRAESMSASECA